MVFPFSNSISKTLLINLKAPRSMSTLIGPPEMQSFLNQLKVETSAAIKAPSMDSNTQLSPQTKPPIQNHSENPCLDFFIHVLPNTRFESVQERLQRAWNHDPLTSLKLICNLRGVRGTGKLDKEGFYASSLWLHQFHPKTLAGNVASMASFGYIKELPEILYRLLEGSDVRKTRKKEWGKIRAANRHRHYTYTLRINERKIRKKQWLLKDAHRRYYTYTPRTKKTSKDEGRIPNPALMVNGEMRILNMLEKGKLLKQKAALLREKKRTAMAEKFLERYHKDSDFRFLYERISDFFAESLKADMEYLKSNQTRKVSLAAKWCPSLDSAFDKSMFLCESIARKVFPRESYPEYEGLEEAHYAYRVRDRLRKEVLVPLRKVLELPEVHMSFNKWGEIQYNRVASVAMNLYKEKFLKHDEERFNKYLVDVKSGKTSMAAGALFPHEIIMSLKHPEKSWESKIAVGVRKVAELQWKRMVDDLRKQGKFKNCMAICGYMDGTAWDVPVAMSLLVSKVSEEPLKGKFIMGIRCPKLNCVKGETLSEKFMSISMEVYVHLTFNYQTAFDFILKVAADRKLKEEDMIKRLLVFTDVEYDQTSGINGWKAKAESILGTSYEKVERKFIEKGYGNSVPEIVFWNLKNLKSTLAITGQKELALISGFSKNLLKLFLDGDGGIDPVSLMEAAIFGKEYQNLVILD